MKNILQEFYYGNIEPQEINSELSDSLKKRMRDLVESEIDLTEELIGENKVRFEQYVAKYNEVLRMRSVDSFLSGFRLGSQFTYDMFFR